MLDKKTIMCYDFIMRNQTNIIVIKNGLVEKSSGRKIVSPVDKLRAYAIFWHSLH